MPIKSEMGAVELAVLEERVNARSNNPAMTAKEIAVRIFSARVHAEAATPGLPELLLCV
jgi:hypothetical protein